jgi:hypothetical protein
MLLAMGNFTDPAWWSDLWQRILRNEIQALLPLLAIATTASVAFDWAGLLLSVLYVGVWTVLKGMAFNTFNYTPTGAAETAWRIASAVAASLVANVPEHFWGYDHWDRVGYGAAGAVLSCLLMLYGTPPTTGAASASSRVLGQSGRTRAV